jgi:hypothetical protein
VLEGLVDGLKDLLGAELGDSKEEGRGGRHVDTTYTTVIFIFTKSIIFIIIIIT